MNFIKHFLSNKKAAFLSTAAMALLFLPTASYAAPPAVDASCADDPIGSIAQFRSGTNHISVVCGADNVWREFTDTSAGTGASSAILELTGSFILNDLGADCTANSSKIEYVHATGTWNCDTNVWADQLQNARTIGGVSFNGTANIVPQTIDVTTDTGNVNHSVTFLDGTTGAQRPKTDPGLLFNPSTNTLTAGTFSGALSGTATNADNVNTDTDTSNATHYLGYYDANNGSYQRTKTDANLTFNPNTNVLTTTTFSGALSGTATNANNINTDTDSGNATHYVSFYDHNFGGVQRPKTDAGLIYNPGTNNLWLEGSMTVYGGYLTITGLPVCTGNSSKLEYSNGLWSCDSTVHADALASNPSNCASGQAARGISASGAAEGCFTPSASLPSSGTMTGTLTLNNGSSTTSGLLNFGTQVRQMINLWGTRYGIGVTNGAIYFRTDNGGGFQFCEGGSHTAALWNCNGGTLAFRIDSSNNAWLNGTLTQASDIRLKKDVSTLDSVSTLQKVIALRGVSYRWNEKAGKDGDYKDRAEVGLIAQEVQKLFPEVVHEGGEGYLSVSYSNLISPIIVAIQEVWGHVQSNAWRIDALEAEIEELKLQNAELIKRLEKPGNK